MFENKNVIETTFDLQFDIVMVYSSAHPIKRVSFSSY